MRPIERDYLQTFADRITPAEWGAICDTALTMAKEGDAKAREWITRLVLGSDPMPLSGLARRETLQLTPEAEIAGEIEYAHTGWMERPTGIDSPLELAEHRQMKLVTKQQAEAELEKRRQERAARKALKAGASSGQACATNSYTNSADESEAA
jgi:hypothetical protein